MGKAVLSSRGFTLMELLVVVAIIGILAAIAIPQYAQYRQRSFDAHALSDLRNAATAEESYYYITEVYLSCANAACTAGLPGFDKSDSVTIEMTADNSGGSPSFTGQASSPSGSRSYSYDSAGGGIQF